MIPLSATDAGMIILGKYTFVMRLTLLTRLVVHILSVPEK
jgi:hypothetical protein